MDKIADTTEFDTLLDTARFPYGSNADNIKMPDIRETPTRLHLGSLPDPAGVSLGRLRISRVST